MMGAESGRYYMLLSPYGSSDGVYNHKDFIQRLEG